MATKKENKQDISFEYWFINKKKLKYDEVK